MNNNANYSPMNQQKSSDNKTALIIVLVVVFAMFILPSLLAFFIFNRIFSTVDSVMKDDNFVHLLEEERDHGETIFDNPISDQSKKAIDNAFVAINSSEDKPGLRWSDCHLIEQLLGSDEDYYSVCGEGAAYKDIRLNGIPGYDGESTIALSDDIYCTVVSLIYGGEEYYADSYQIDEDEYGSCGGRAVEVVSDVASEEQLNEI